MKSIMIIFLAAFFAFSLPGCGKAGILDQYNTGGIEYLEYTDIDTVCDTQELTEAGADLLSSMEECLLLSFVVDSSIEITEELGDYDHLILTNPQWIERFGELGKLELIEYNSLSDSMQEFLDVQMPIWMVDEVMLPDGVGLYQYGGSKLLAFPVNVPLGASKPIEAKNPLIILVDKPAKLLKASSCMLPLTSSGNVLFTNGAQLKEALHNSKLRDYGTVQVLQDNVR